MVELEIKLLPTTPGGIGVLLTDEGFLGELNRLGAPPRLNRLLATYFDSSDRRLRQQRLVYRERASEDGVTATLKGPSEGSDDSLGLAVRQEWEVGVPSIGGDVSQLPDGPMRRKVVAALQGRKLLPLFQVEVERTTCLLSLEGGTSAELAIDRGRVMTDHSSDQVDELELELVEGPSAPMLALAEHWKRTFGLRPGRVSKFARGEALLQ